jgi:hypothetical protein
MTAISKLSQADLAELLGKANAARKAAEAIEEQYKAEVLKRGITHILGQTFEVKVSTSTVESVDKDKIKEVMGADWLGQFLKASPRTTIRTNVRKDVAANLGSVEV